MQDIRSKLHKQISNQNNNISLFNKLSGFTITVSIFFSIISTEGQIDLKFGETIDQIDWVIGCLFSIEYLCRLWTASLEDKGKKGVKGIASYMLSPMAIIDLIAIIPSFIGVRTELKILRIVRLLTILKIGRSERFKQSIFHFNNAIRSKSQELQISTVYTLLLLLSSSTLMYLSESSVQPELLGSIPRCLWWSITTVSAVGYGDSVPITVVGKIIASTTSLMGIGAIAIPTGILAAGFSESISRESSKLESSIPSKENKV
tara:strand:+ start:1267 stop:2049 length:783 start_codon:yes stop_codon:yes gene_type:complete